MTAAESLENTCLYPLEQVNKRAEKEICYQQGTDGPTPKNHGRNTIIPQLHLLVSGKKSDPLILGVLLGKILNKKR